MGASTAKTVAAIASVASWASAASLAAVTLTGCGATDGLMSSVALPASGTASTDAEHPSLARMAEPKGDAPSGAMAVTSPQRAYLDALAADGVRPSSELLALSIGSYVCQARMAGQSPQVVWAFVHPLVEGDVQRTGGARSDAGDDVDMVTRAYIRIADDHLC